MSHYLASLILFLLPVLDSFLYRMFLNHMLDLNWHLAKATLQHRLFLMLVSEYALLPYLIACLHLLFPVALYALRLLGPPELVSALII